jgi:hypothetical protein
VDHVQELDAHAVEDRLRAECGDVSAAIALVARGTASRVTVSGLAFGEQLLVLLAPEAERAGVRLVASWWPEDAGCGLTVQRADA